MKKTLIALLALGSVAMAYDNVVWTSATTATGTAAKGDYQGFTFTIADTIGNRATSTPSVEGTALPSYVYLDSISFAFASDAAVGNYTRDILLVDSSSTVISSINNLVCRNSGEGDRMFTVTGFAENLALNTDETYSLVFCNSGAIQADGALVGQTLPTTIGLNNGNLRLAVIGASTDEAAKWGLIAKNTASEPASTAYAPKLLILTHAPEPATATLSLLALAGLASRRRRH